MFDPAERLFTIVSVIIVIIVSVIIIGLALWGAPKYRIYKLDLNGQAMLREAEWTKKIAIEEARAEKESATELAAAEVERAKGVAQANEIIGDSLKGNSEYLRYLWIEGLKDENNETIYIPTEAGLPILEATRALR